MEGPLTRRRKCRKVTRERPGLASSALFHLIRNSVLLMLSDVASGLPPYEEQVPPLSEEKLYPKEKALVVAERMKSCRVLVYATHTGTRDITGRMDDILTRHGSRVGVIKADTVAPDRREVWVADKVKQGIDVLICHPWLVQTGLDLIDFQTLCWYETEFSVYVMRQASRRSWRIGQTRPVKVVFMSYQNTLQAGALKLVAKKPQSSLAVEVELLEDGLAAYGYDGDDLMMALARKIVSGDEEDTETVEEVFAQARAAEPSAEEYLVDDGWKLVESLPALDAGWSLRPSGSTATGRRRSSWAWATAATPTATGTDTRLPRSTATYTGTSRTSRLPVADAVLLGGVHGRGTDEAKGPGPEAATRNSGPV